MSPSPLQHIVLEIATLQEKKLQPSVLNETVEVFDNFTTVEIYPLKRLLTLYNYLSDLSIDHPLNPDIDKLFDFSLDGTINGKLNTQLKVIEKILNLPDDMPYTVDNCELIVINAYGFKTIHCQGRFYGFKNTMTLISRQCRYYLFKGMYFDVDLKNAHPTMLLSYAKDNNIEAKVLEEYVSNREKFLCNVMDNDKITREQAKIAVLRCINLTAEKSLPPTLQLLHRDILPIRDHIWQNNIIHLTKLGEYTMSREGFANKSLEKQKVSLQAIYCATEESKSLRVLYEVCLQKGLLNRDATLNRKVRTISFIPFFDGAYIKFDKLTEDGVRQILEDVNELIAPYCFELKTINPEWKYLNEEDLKNYEIIQDFLGGLPEKQYLYLLKLLDIPEFNLKEDVLNSILSKSNDSHVEVISEEQFFELNENNFDQFAEFIHKSSKRYKYLIRRKLLSHIKSGTFLDLQMQLRPKQ